MTAIGSTEFSDEIENFVKHVMQRYETGKNNGICVNSRGQFLSHQGKVVKTVVYLI